MLDKDAEIARLNQEVAALKRQIEQLTKEDDENTRLLMANKEYIEKLERQIDWLR